MSDGYGQMVPPHNNSEFNRTIFQSKLLTAKMRTMIPVRVVKVYKQDGKTAANQGDVAGAGFVDVQPVVSQIDGKNQRMDHETVYHVPYTRMYGGSAAIICDPVKGDIGYIHCSDRDISAFKDQVTQGSTQNVLPGSRRRHDMADSIYIGGVKNKAPTQYVTFGADGSTTVVGKSGNKTVHDAKGNVQVIPGSGGLVFLGGTGSDGSYDFVVTLSGPSSNVKAKL